MEKEYGVPTTSKLKKIKGSFVNFSRGKEVAY